MDQNLQTLIRRNSVDLECLDREELLGLVHHLGNYAPDRQQFEASMRQKLDWTQQARDEQAVFHITDSNGKVLSYVPVGAPVELRTLAAETVFVHDGVVAMTCGDPTDNGTIFIFGSGELSSGSVADPRQQATIMVQPLRLLNSPTDAPDQGGI